MLSISTRPKTARRRSSSSIKKYFSHNLKIEHYASLIGRSVSTCTCDRRQGWAGIGRSYTSPPSSDGNPDEAP